MRAREHDGKGYGNNVVVVVVASPLSCSRAHENGRARALAGFGE